MNTLQVKRKWGKMKRLKNKKFIEMMVVGLLVLAAVITGIYFIPDEKLANILSTILAALISGSLTLSGVAWTITSNRKKDRREEALKCKPMFRYCDVPNENIPEDAQNFFFIDGEVAEKQYTINNMCFKNFDNANFIIESVEVNDILLKPLEIVSIEKGKYFRISFSLGAGRGVESFLLNIKDILGNLYQFALVRQNGLIKGICEVEKE